MENCTEKAATAIGGQSIASEVEILHVAMDPIELRLTSNVSDGEVVYPKGLRLVLIMLSLCLVSFSVGLNYTIISMAVPSIAAEFKALQDVGWYGSAFFLADTSLQPLMGKLFTFWPGKKVYLCVLLLFQGGVITSATAKSSTAFIVGRAIAGAGSAGLASGGINLISHLAPREQRPMYMSIILSLNIICSSAGPILGGFLTKSLSGPQCFFVVAPMPFIATMMLALLFQPTHKPAQYNLTLKSKIRLFDPLGCLLLTSPVLSLLIALHYGSSSLPWTHRSIIVPLVACCVLLSAFNFSRYFSPEDVATIPKRVFSRRAIWASCGLGLTMFLVVTCHQFFLPYYFQAARFYSPVQSGVHSMPYFLAFTLSCIATGVLPVFIGYYNPFMILGAALALVAAGLMHTIKLDTPVAAYLGYQVLGGLGTAMGGMATIVAVNSALQEEDQPIGLAMVIMSQLLGDAITVCTSNTIFIKSLLKQFNSLSNLPPDIIEIIMANPLHLRAAVPPILLRGTLRAFAKSVSTVFVLPIAAASVALLFALAGEWVPVPRESKQDKCKVDPEREA